MEKDEALQIIKQVTSAFRGNLSEHQAIQEAVKTLETLSEEKKK